MTDYHPVHLAINTVVLLVLVAAKLPELHGVRIFHINEAPNSENDSKDE